jgi:hypothetical protein
VKGTIASTELYVFDGGAKPRRLTLTITAPEREPEGGWVCRVALANLHRPQPASGIDSVAALEEALARARGWIGELRAQGLVLCRDRAGQFTFESI